jgi:hypothetical protein
MPATVDDGCDRSLPKVAGKKVTTAFDDGTIISGGGVLLLAGADKRLVVKTVVVALTAFLITTAAHAQMPQQWKSPATGGIRTEYVELRGAAP